MYEYLICICIKAENYDLKVKPGLAGAVSYPRGKDFGAGGVARNTRCRL